MKQRTSIAFPLVILIILLSCFMAAGCILRLDEPNAAPSFASIPVLLMDYDHDEGTTKLWVKSALSDHRYSNITIEITGPGGPHIIDMDNYTYCHQVDINLTKFYLDVKVCTSTTIYVYSCDVEVNTVEDPIFLITPPEKEAVIPIRDTVIEVIRDDLPWKEMLTTTE